MWDAWLEDAQKSFEGPEEIDAGGGFLLDHSYTVKKRCIVELLKNFKYCAPLGSNYISQNSVKNSNCK